ncbi:hypothetical protein ERO13_A05G176050v2 [Gossypium hirsutum]|uniref:DUF241 domain protein n=2 Tax=Gossypium TaxID=3633 RepID=A0A2P5WW53_GOSBA|nr:uncharacterized protein LOC107902672 [Gossypium hirsutum]KAB2082229.1 hypothetical protein ES319_A05G184600v1 [Gossypium barbadense]KAG4199900.1 hypothetical protein ERO13_A05G176050v2 [Gossypium hirsutum]PPR95316.1 hypothetical protein GOBAR_AA25356 [Gossypium barbadense]
MVATRSNSFPRSSRQHPLATEVNEHLNRLRASKEASTSSSSSISHKLNGFQDLYDCVVKFLQLPLSHHDLAHECADELLDGSLRLLDLCSTAKDIVLQTKESANELQSALRRRKIGESEIVSEARKYISSRKVAKKTIHKALGNLKVIQRKNTVSPSETVSMLKEIEAVTCSMFEDLLSLISGPKPGSWLSVSKLLHQRRIACEDAARNVNEFEKVDVALKSFGITKSEIINLEIQNQLKDLELFIQDLEDGLECLFRCMIKARVSLLNILTL